MAEGKVATNAELLRAQDARIDMKDKYQSRKEEVAVLETYLGELMQEREQLHQARRVEKFQAKAAEWALFNVRDRFTLFSLSINIGQQFLAGRFKLNLEHFLSAVAERLCGETKLFQMNICSEVGPASMTLREGL